MAIDRSARGTVWNIQILRFVAAAMVLFSHLNNELSKFPAMAGDYIRFQPVWWPGGVDIFFVISGFIMYYIAFDMFGRPGASVDFMQRRLVRLLPPYWFFTTLTLAAMLIVPRYMTLSEILPTQVLGSYLFMPALNAQGRPFPVLVLGWTLEFEMLFYAFFAIGLCFRRIIGIAIVAILILATSALNFHFPLPMPLAFWADPILLEFLFGIGIAMAYRRGIRLNVWTAALVTAVGIAALLWLQVNGYPNSGWRYRFLWAGLPSTLICASIALVPESPRPGVFKRALVLLGDSSYALYLSHPFVLGAVAVVVLRIGLADPWAYIVVAGMACVVASVAFHLLMEKPVHACLSKRVSARIASRRSRALRSTPGGATTGLVTAAPGRIVGGQDEA